MAFPVVASRVTGVSGTTDTTSHSITMPSGVTAGDLIVVFFSSDGSSSTSTSSTGWFKLGESSGVTLKTSVFRKVATGSDSLTITTGSAEQSSYIAMRITGGATIEGFQNNAVGTNPDPIAFTPVGSASAKDYLWICALGRDGTSLPSAAPSGFSNLTTRAASGVNGVTTSTAERNLNATTLNPGTWTASTSIAWANWTCAIAPYEAPPSGDIVEDFEDGSYNVNLSGTWFQTQTVPGTGFYCFRSNNTADSTSGSCIIEVPADAVSVTFKYRCHCEPVNDTLQFFNNGNFVFEDSGQTPWATAGPYAVTPGTDLTWTYEKDSTTSSGTNAVYIDDVIFTLNTPPVADAGSDYSVTTGETIFLGAEGSTDAEDDLEDLQFTWTVVDADGSGITTGDINIAVGFPYSGDLPAPSVPPGQTYELVFQVEVEDTNGATDTDTITVTVNPIATATDVTGSGGLLVAGTADVEFEEGGNDIVASGGISLAGTADILFITPSFETGSGGVELGGDASFRFITPTFVTGAGGIEVGGDATYRFSAPAVSADVVVEWDFDNDNDFSDTVEDITQYVVSVETLTGRDWPSMLTGKAGPGKLKVLLRNDDNRFSYFNSSSPLNAGNNSLRTGRKIRIRTLGTSNPDPVPLVRDRFSRSDGTMGTAELGGSYAGPLANDFAILNNRAVPTNDGNAHIALLDVGSTNYYAQVQLGDVGRMKDNTGNVVGIVYRYQDTNDYSLAVLDIANQELRLQNVVAGVTTTLDSRSTEVYDNMVIGVLVDQNAATMYCDGVQVLGGTAIQTDETSMGLYAVWAVNHVLPEFDNFYSWIGIPSEREGILWTGDVSDVIENISLGPEKIAEVQATGILARAANIELTPTRSVVGRKTGLVVGNTLGQAGLLLPPEEINEGTVTTGAFGMESASALEICRQFEEAEFGFLSESQEGYIRFESRTFRDDKDPLALFSDDENSQLGYHMLEPKDWKGEVVNRVIAGVSPLAPSGITVESAVGDDLTSAESNIIWDPASNTVPGELLIAIVSASASDQNNDFKPMPEFFTFPEGWEVLDGKPLDVNSPSRSWTSRVFAKVADGVETTSQPAAFGLQYFTSFLDDLGEDIEIGSYCITVFRIANWFGSLKDGVVVSDFGKGTNSPAVFPDWGPSAPSLFITVLYGGDTSGGAGTVGTLVPPANYEQGSSSPIQVTSDPTWGAFECALAWATRTDVVAVENPGAWTGTFSGFRQTYAVTIAVRGPNGDPPIKNGVVTVVKDDLQSQLDHNALLTHRDAASIFADEEDAETYADLVLNRFADDRPIFSLKFWANKNAAHRAQAIRRRVSDKITLVANNQVGMGVSGDFFIESIAHRITNGGKVWETTWELSPDTADEF